MYVRLGLANPKEGIAYQFNKRIKKKNTERKLNGKFNKK